MKAGHVVSIRVNPRDCQSVLDLLDAAGIPRRALTFAQCVSLALGSSLETFRKDGTLPEVDEFEYLNRMQPYLGRMAKRVRVANTIHSAGGERRSRTVYRGEEAGTAAQDSIPESAAPVEATPQVVAATPEETARFTQLLMASDTREMTEVEKEEYKILYKKFYPDG